VSQINLNDGSVEGLRHHDLPIETVQYHPEGSPGPLDIPKGTVMSRLFHARLKMQKILNEYLELDESKQGVGSEENS
jgi:carbamoylphosphate synthase small subunit